MTLASFLLPPPSIGAEESATKIAALADTADAFHAVTRKARDAVVYLQVKKSATNNTADQRASDEFFNDPLLQTFFGEEKKKTPNSRDKQITYAHGSGFIINRNGYILTNSHVVDKALEITIHLIDKRKFTAEIIGQDQKSDVALIKIDAKNLPILSLGDSSSLKVGEWAIAVGSPFEMIQTVTAGIISATGRSSVGISEYEDFIQTDAAINPGNSGGPLLNIHGEVIGINTAFLTQTGGYMGIGFAIPINMATIIAERLQKDGKMTRAWLGAVLKDASPDDLLTRQHLTTTNAALISRIRDNSPAANSSLQEKDLIVSINDINIAGAADLRNRIALSAPGTTITLQFIRNGQKLSTSVVLGAKEEAGEN